MRIGSHDLRALLRRTSVALGRVGLDPLPDEFAIAVQLFDRIDDGRSTRLRYPGLWDRARRILAPRFPPAVFATEATVAPLGQIATLLRRIIAEHCRYTYPIPELPSFRERGYQRVHEAEIDIQASLMDLERETRNGSLRWSVIDEYFPNLDQHEELQNSGLSLMPRYLEATRNHRQLILVPAGGQTTRRQDGNVITEPYLFDALASRLGDGLSHFVFPMYHSSNLGIFAAEAANADVVQRKDP